MTLLVFALLGACSNEDTGDGDTDSPKPSTGSSNETTSPSEGFEESTLRETTGATREATLAESIQRDPRASEVVLRLEGTPKTGFRGLCTVGTRNEVLGGQVPERFGFDLDGQELSCRIQRKGSGNGALKVILLDGDQTRSVQSTQSNDGTIKLSYAAN